MIALIVENQIPVPSEAEGSDIINHESDIKED